MNLKIKNAKIAEVRKDKNHVFISFDIKWKEAWKTKINCDGVYIFGKYKSKDGLWKHINLSGKSVGDFNYKNQTPEGYSTGKGKAAKKTGIWVPETRKGFFIHLLRGEMDIDLTSVSFPWDITGLTEDFDKAEIKIMGIEMVYIPFSKHFVGDPSTENRPTNCLFKYPSGAYFVKTEEPIEVDKKKGYLYCEQDNERSRDEVPFTIPETFPKGVKPFWYMKYGLSSRQYVDFLNTLTRKQQQTHVRSDISGDVIEHYYVMTDSDTEQFRQAIMVTKDGHGTTEPVTFYTYAPERACNAIAWKDVAAFAAWAGLRPVTDFEFEKACRGPLPAVPWECAWGSNEIGMVWTFDGADGSGKEVKVPKEGLVNACFARGIAPFDAAAGKTEATFPGWEGPVSIGLLSKTRHEGIDKRLNDGAGYYGNLELSGNLWEFIVTFGNPKGRAFKPVHGTGELDGDGFARVESWPDESGEGTGARGGVYRSPSAKYLAVALRFAGAHAKSTPRFNGGLRVGF
ncbi:MAG: SUMF1/EgtB/PvdO family nonheme iron enzyme [bacterium]|nr:SUMF1/EgtB/PvdO family nonheme iron enzyme [bacterium]